MRQLIARIDEDLHADVKRRARALGISVNALVAEVLHREVARTQRDAVYERFEREGLIVYPEPPSGGVPSLDDIEGMTRGWGAATSDALQRERDDAR